jgi:hypothetical protein
MEVVMQFLVDFLKSLLKEPAVRVVLVGAVVNVLLALVGLIPNPPAWLTPPLLALIQAVGVFVETFLAGWAASRVKVLYYLLKLSGTSADWPK